MSWKPSWVSRSAAPSTVSAKIELPSVGTSMATTRVRREASEPATLLGT